MGFFNGYCWLFQRFTPVRVALPRVVPRQDLERDPHSLIPHLAHLLALEARRRVQTSADPLNPLSIDPRGNSTALTRTLAVKTRRGCSETGEKGKVFIDILIHMVIMSTFTRTIVLIVFSRE